MASLGAGGRDAEPARAAAADFLLEGLCALKKISRTDEGRLFGTPAATRPRSEPRVVESLTEDDDEPVGRGKKKYYN
jgi:hypothetical protein